MKLKLFILFGILIAIFIFFQVTNTQSTPNNRVVIGSILPLSGDLSFVGTQMKKGIELAASEYQENEVKIIFEDDQTYNDVAAINAINKLININDSDIIFNVAVNTIKTLDPVLNDNGVPGIVLWDSNYTIYDLHGDIYGFGYSTEKTGKKMAQYAYSNLGVHKVAVITAQDEWSNIISDSFITQFQNLGGNITVQKIVSADEIDFRSILLQAKQLESEAIYFPLFPEPTIKAVKQARELGFETLLTGDGLIDISLETEGIYSTQTWVDDVDFSNKYKEYFDEEMDPVGLSFSALGYDAVHFVMLAVDRLHEQGKKITPANISRGMGFIEVSGITGVNSFKKTHITDKVQSITVVKNGKLEVVE